MQALIINTTLKRSPTQSNTEALAQVVVDNQKEHGVRCEMVRAVDHAILPGVSSDEGAGDDWPALHDKVLAADILVIASPIAN